MKIPQTLSQIKYHNLEDSVSLVETEEGRVLEVFLEGTPWIFPDGSKYRKYVQETTAQQMTKTANAELKELLLDNGSGILGVSTTLGES